MAFDDAPTLSARTALHRCCGTRSGDLFPPDRAGAVVLRPGAAGGRTPQENYFCIPAIRTRQTRISPPAKPRSLILPVTDGCSWNHCYLLRYVYGSRKSASRAQDRSRNPRQHSPLR